MLLWLTSRYESDCLLYFSRTFILGWCTHMFLIYIRKTKMVTFRRKNMRLRILSLLFVASDALISVTDTLRWRSVHRIFYSEAIFISISTGDPERLIDAWSNQLILGCGEKSSCLDEQEQIKHKKKYRNNWSNWFSKYHFI